MRSVSPLRLDTFECILTVPQTVDIPHRPVARIAMNNPNIYHLLYAYCVPWTILDAAKLIPEIHTASAPWHVSVPHSRVILAE
jgi:hypothetical protein